MRRRHASLAIGLGAVSIALAASWFGWGRDGLTPVDPASSQAERILDLYIFIGLVAVAVFLSVTIPLVLILSRDGARGAPRAQEGAQVHGHLRLELIWTAVPLFLVLLIAGVTWYMAGSINDQAAGARAPDVRVSVEGRQFYWRYIYENGAVSIDNLRLPVGRLVELQVTAPAADVVHSFWVPALNGKVDAIPGKTTYLTFRPDEVGRYDGRCGELCGIQHAAMELVVEVMPMREFGRWLDANRPGAPEQDLGAMLFGGVCSKCHGAAPEYAPDLQGNLFLRDADSLRQIVRHGRGRMPAVARGWSEREVDALVRFAAAVAGERSSADGG